MRMCFNHNTQSDSEIDNFMQVFFCVSNESTLSSSKLIDQNDITEMQLIRHASHLNWISFRVFFLMSFKNLFIFRPFVQ